jgi:uncharacterized membrane protein (DUF2068 family)
MISEVRGDKSLLDGRGWPWGTVPMIWLAIAGMGIPGALMGIGLLLVKVLDGCRWDEGSFAQGCTVLTFSVNWLIDALLVYGFFWLVSGIAMWLVIAFPVWFVLSVVKWYRTA